MRNRATLIVNFETNFETNLTGHNLPLGVETNTAWNGQTIKLQNM